METTFFLVRTWKFFVSFFLLTPAAILMGSSLQAQTCENGGACNPSLNKTIYVDGVTYTLVSAIAAANGVGNTTIIVSSSQTVTGGLALTGTGVALVCQNNATLAAGSEGFFWILELRGSAESVKNCTISPGGNSSAAALVLVGATNAIIEGNTISGFQAGTGLIYLSGAVSPVIRNNRLRTGSGGPDCIFGEKNTTNADVEGNFVDETAGAAGEHAIAFHSTSSGESVTGTKIVNNAILAGLNFCVEVGAFGGLTPARVIVNSNNCKLTENGGSGGYSINATGSTISENRFQSNGYTATVAAYEVVLSSNTVVTDNSTSIGQDWIFISTSAITINSSSGITFSRNTINGWGTGDPFGTSGWGIMVCTCGHKAVSVSNNVVSGNVLAQPVNQVAGGIFQQCQTDGSTCSNNAYSENLLTGSNVAKSLGFRLEDDIGTMQNTLITGNSITGFSTGIAIWNPTVTGTTIYYNVFSTTGSHVNNNGTGTVIAP